MAKIREKKLREIVDVDTNVLDAAAVKPGLKVTESLNEYILSLLEHVPRRRFVIVPIYVTNCQYGVWAGTLTQTYILFNKHPRKEKVSSLFSSVNVSSLNKISNRSYHPSHHLHTM